MAGLFALMNFIKLSGKAQYCIDYRDKTYPITGQFENRDLI